MLTIKNILFPTDFSETSIFAFRLACALARDYGSRLVILHVAEPVVAVSDLVMLTVPVEADRKALWERLRNVQPADAALAVEHRLAEGEPAAEILRAAEETSIDVIVLGTHGRRGLSRVLLGSVAEQVLRRASCPVVTVKPPEKEAVKGSPEVAAPNH